MFNVTIRLVIFILLFVEGISLSSSNEGVVPIQSSPKRLNSAPPTFEDYGVPSNDIFKGKIIVKVNLKSHPEARQYRTVLRNGFKGEANFSGSYKIVTHGCGAGCQQIWIIDAKTGQVILTTNTEKINSKCNGTLSYRTDSRLLIVGDCENETDYLVFDGKALRSVAKKVG